MNAILKKYPVPATGLILGLASAGNLVQSYGEVFRNMFGLAAAVLFLLMLAKMIKFPADVRTSLDNPIIASVFPTLTMGSMILSTYIKPFTPGFAYAMWTASAALHVVLIVLFTKKYVLNFKIKTVFPSWFIVYVGIAVASVTGPAYKMTAAGQTAFWFGLVSYLILLPTVIYRVAKVGDMAEPSLPSLVIFAAPASLLLAGYMNSFEAKNMAIVWFLMVLSMIMYVAVLVFLVKLLRLKFYPSYSAFTFPLVISGIAMKLTNGFLIKTNQPMTWLKFIVKFQEAAAVLMVIYVLYRYVKFLSEKPKSSDLPSQQPSK
ncbi:MAG: TDT family transporter [Sedimentibacter sp.]|uniref:TDT family transporter n=1 Tax=Sedimentibacter sp. TaxID=1960295 RepID=UPI003157F3F8